MSCIELCVVMPNGDVERDRDLRNSWGGAVRIWDAVYAQYMHPKPIKYGREVEHFLGLGDEDQQRFWELAHSEVLPQYVRRVYAFTFDNATVPPDECVALADDVERFDRVFPVPPEHANHLPAIAAWLRESATRDIRAVAVNWTSVSDAWPNKPIDPNDREGDYRPWNVDTDGERVLSSIVPTHQREAAGHE